MFIFKYVILKIPKTCFRSYGFWITALNKAGNWKKRGKKRGVENPKYKKYNSGLPIYQEY